MNTLEKEKLVKTNLLIDENGSQIKTTAISDDAKKKLPVAKKPSRPNYLLRLL